MKRGLALVATLAALAAASCNLVAGLDQFHRAGTGGAGGAASSVSSSSHTTATSSSSKSTTSSSSKTTAVSSSTGAACADHVLVNEVLLNQTNSAEFVELYNPTASTVDLSTYEIDALETTMPVLGAKWKGSTGTPLMLPPGGYVFLESGSVYPNPDGGLSTISKAKDPTVVVLFNGGVVVDSLCVCSGATCSFSQGQEFCAGRALMSPTFHTTNTQSASRSSCVDTDNDANDFVLVCPTPGQPNSTTTCP